MFDNVWINKKCHCSSRLAHDGPVAGHQAWPLCSTSYQTPTPTRPWLADRRSLLPGPATAGCQAPAPTREHIDAPHPVLDLCMAVGSNPPSPSPRRHRPLQIAVVIARVMNLSATPPPPKSSALKPLCISPYWVPAVGDPPTSPVLAERHRFPPISVSLHLRPLHLSPSVSHLPYSLCWWCRTRPRHGRPPREPPHRRAPSRRPLFATPSSPWPSGEFPLSWSC
jgi:hypothetical protein